MIGFTSYTMLLQLLTGFGEKKNPQWENYILKLFLKLFLKFLK